MSSPDLSVKFLAPRPVARRQAPPPGRPTVAASRNPFRVWRNPDYYTDRLILNETDN